MSATHPVRAFVGLGANLGDRSGQLQAALRALRATPGVGQVECSRVYETAPVGPPQPHYLNAVASLTTTLSARALLARLLAIEGRAGRVRAEPGGPRTLDLDLLLFGDQCIDEPGLRVPHPRMHERPFVLEPFCDLAPRARHPQQEASVAELRDRVHDPKAAWLHEEEDA